MNRVRIGILLIVAAAIIGIGGAVAVALGASLTLVVAVAVAAEAIFWIGVLLLGHSTYKLARANGLRRVPGELWRLFRDPARTPNDDRHAAS